MKLLAAIVGWGLALIIGMIGFALVKHESEWRDAEIAKLREESKALRQDLSKAERDHAAKMERLLGLVDKLKAISDLENEGREVEERIRQIRLSRAGMTDLNAKHASIVKEADEQVRLSQITEEIGRIGVTARKDAD